MQHRLLTALHHVPCITHCCSLSSVLLALLSCSQYQHYLDASVPHLTARWVALGVLVFLYCLRVYMLQGFYIVTYGLGIFLLNLLIGFISPLEEDLEGNGPLLPTGDQDEFKPFIRRLPEFKFW